MGIVSFGSILIAGLAAYGYSSAKIAGKTEKEHVSSVEAGPTSEVTSESLKAASYDIPRKMLLDSKGNVVNGPNTLRVSVNGNCMMPVGIKNGDELIVEKIDPEKSLDEQIEIGDVLLIHLEDNGIDKLRIFDGYTDRGSLSTYRYEGETKVPSSKPHQVSSVVGKVVYIVEKKY